MSLVVRTIVVVVMLSCVALQHAYALSSEQPLFAAAASYFQTPTGSTAAGTSSASKYARSCYACSAIL